MDSTRNRTVNRPAPTDAGGGDDDAAALLSAALAGLKPRTLDVLKRRMFADEPESLDAIGLSYGVTRERIRQVERDGRTAMNAVVAANSALATLASLARRFVTTVRALDELVELLPPLAATVDAVPAPLWRVLAGLDGSYTGDGVWCASPSLSVAIARTRAHVEQRSGDRDAVRVDRLTVVETVHPDRQNELSTAWLEHCGFRVHDGWVFSNFRTARYAAAILWAAGTPLTAPDLTARIGSLTLRSLRTRLESDARFVRVGRDVFALAEWGMEPYEGVRAAMKRRLESGGGRVSVSELASELAATYAISEESVRTYACAPPFVTHDGIVEYAPAPKAARHPPERSKRAFRWADGWAYRTKVSRDHLRGSGTTVPMAIATQLGLRHGDSVYLDSDRGPQYVAWLRPAAETGSIRRFLVPDEIPLGAEIFLVITDDRRFRIEHRRDLVGDPLPDALALVGAPPSADRDVARAALVHAAALPVGTPVADVVDTFRARKDHDIADLVTAAFAASVPAGDARGAGADGPPA